MHRWGARCWFCSSWTVAQGQSSPWCTGLGKRPEEQQGQRRGGVQTASLQKCSCQLCSPSRQRGRMTHNPGATPQAQHTYHSAYRLVMSCCNHPLCKVCAHSLWVLILNLHNTPGLFNHACYSHTCMFFYPLAGACLSQPICSTHQLCLHTPSLLWGALPFFHLLALTECPLTTSVAFRPLIGLHTKNSSGSSSRVWGRQLFRLAAS